MGKVCTSTPYLSSGQCKCQVSLAVINNPYSPNDGIAAAKGNILHNIILKLWFSRQKRYKKRREVDLKCYFYSPVDHSWPTRAPKIDIQEMNWAYHLLMLSLFIKIMKWNFSISKVKESICLHISFIENKTHNEPKSLYWNKSSDLCVQNLLKQKKTNH